MGIKKSLTKKPLKKSGSFNPIPITYIESDQTERVSFKIFKYFLIFFGCAGKNAIFIGHSALPQFSVLLQPF